MTANPLIRPAAASAPFIVTRVVIGPYLIYAAATDRRQLASTNVASHYYRHASRRRSDRRRHVDPEVPPKP